MCISIRDFACAIPERSGVRLENTKPAHRRSRQVPHRNAQNISLFSLKKLVHVIHSKDNISECT